MTDTTEDLELFDNATTTFPSKFDLKDRLVAIWVTGKHGSRPGANGKPYDWYETITLVLDDPKGVLDWDERVKDKEKDWVDTLVPSVVKNGPQRLDAFQWSTGGVAARLKPRLNQKDSYGNPVYRPMIGRVDERPSQQKGQTNPWTVVPATEADMDFIRSNFVDIILKITKEVKGLREGTGSDDSAFE